MLEKGEYDPSILVHGHEVLIDGAKILTQAYNDFQTGTTREKVAMRFHRTIARATADAAGMVAQTMGCDRVCLTGGCFQNVILLENTVALLKKAGLKTFVHRRIPPNDECVSYGQLVIAGARKEKGLQ